MAALPVGCADGGPSTTGPTEWDLVTVSNSEVRIVVYVGSSSCNSLADVAVEEDSEQVGINATVTIDGGEDCTSDMTTSEETIQLDSPIGARTLVGCRPPSPLVSGRQQPLRGGCMATVPNGT